MPKKLTILVVELNYHADLLKSVCTLLKSHFDVVLLTTERIWDESTLADGDVLNYGLMSEKESLKDFFGRLDGLVKMADIIFFSTLERHFHFFRKYTFSAPVIIRLHNINTAFLPFRSIDFGNTSLFSIFRFLLVKVVIGRYWKAKKAVLNNADSLMMPSDSIRSYVIAQSMTSHPQKIAPISLPIYTLEPTIFTDVDNKEAKFLERPEKVVFAVLGNVDPKRKCYKDLQLALSSAIPRFSVPVELKLLGSVKKKSGQELVRQFGRLRSDGFQLSCSDRFIPLLELQQILSDVDFFIAPINVNTTYSINREVYGRTKVSGAEGDVVRYRKPTIICSEYQLPVKLMAVCDQYQGVDELTELLVTWVNQRIFEQKQQNFSQMSDSSANSAAHEFLLFCEGVVNDKNICNQVR